MNHATPTPRGPQPGATPPPSPPTSTERGEETRLSLLSAGRRVFAQRGFDGASVREITREAGANLGAVTYHFGSKRAFYVQVVTEAFTPLVDRVEQAARRDGTPSARLTRVVEILFDFLGANPDLPRLLLQEISAGKKPPPELVTLIQKNLRNISSILADGWRDGSLRQGHPVLSALSVISQPIYMSVMAPLLKDVGGLDLTDPEVRTLATHHVNTFVLAGLAGPREEETP